MKVAIFGMGLIGGSLARDLRAGGFAQEIIAVEQNPEHARLVLDLKLADRVCSTDEALASANVLIAATPVGSLTTLLPALLQRIQPHQTLLDVGSTKVPVLASVNGHPMRRRFVATHPMAGTEYSGPTAAQCGLFSGKRCVFSNIADSAPDALATAQALYQSLGMEIVELDAESHDLHVAYISHISHIASFALAHTVLEKEKEEERIFELAGGGFSSTARLAKSNANTWVPIFAQNRDNVLDVLNEYIASVCRFRDLLQQQDYACLDAFIRQSNAIGRIIDRK